MVWFMQKECANYEELDNFGGADLQLLGLEYNGIYIGINGTAEEFEERTQ